MKKPLFLHLSLDEIRVICAAIHVSLTRLWYDKEFRQQYGRADWFYQHIDIPTGRFAIQTPDFGTDPEALPELHEAWLKILWQLQNFLLVAYGHEPISAIDFFPTESLRQWGSSHE